MVSLKKVEKPLVCQHAGAKTQYNTCFFTIVEQKHNKTDAVSTYLSDNTVKHMVVQHFWLEKQMFFSLFQFFTYTRHLHYTLTLDTYNRHLH